MIRSLRSQLYESPVISCLMSSERPGERENVQPFFSLNNNNNKRVEAEKVWDFNMLQVATISSLNIPLRQQKKIITTNLSSTGTRITRLRFGRQSAMESRMPLLSLNRENLRSIALKRMWKKRRNGAHKPFS